MRIDRPVTLAESTELPVPITAGWRRPVIVLPKAMADGCGSRVADAVLLHELYHIQDGSDYSRNVLRRVMRAFYGPQPLHWLAAPVIRGVREHACDVVCVGALGGDLEYRAALVEVAAGLLAGRRSNGISLGMAMARSARLKRRLKRCERSGGIGNGLMRPWRRRAKAAATLAIVGALLGGDRCRSSCACGSLARVGDDASGTECRQPGACRRRQNSARGRSSRCDRSDGA